MQSCRSLTLALALAVAVAGPAAAEARLPAAVTSRHALDLPGGGVEVTATAGDVMALYGVKPADAACSRKIST